MSTLKFDVHAFLQSRGVMPGGAVQLFIAHEAIRMMDPYTPKDTGMLIRSAATEDGTEIHQATPYGRRHYYNAGGVDKNGRSYGPVKFQGAPKRGAFWFERMKNEGGRESIGSSAARMAGATFK